MLSDYKRYLIKIRNSFIRSGVELSLDNIDTYEDIFYLGENLSDLLWFYSILEVSGSEDKLRGFMFPLNSTYKESIRDRYFEDYLVYRATYMEISASDYLKKEELKVKKEETNVAIDSSPLSFLERVNLRKSMEEEDDEILGDSNDYDDVNYDNWGNNDEDEIYEAIEEDEVDYNNWNNSEDDYSEEGCDIVIEDYEEDEIDYNNKEDSNINAEEDDDEEDEFISYSVEESEDEETIEDYDTYDNWGNNEEDEDYEEIIEDENYEDIIFDNWGNNEDLKEGDISETEEDDEDDFDNWGSGGDSYVEDFDNWGNSDEDEVTSDTSYEEDEDLFENWGSDNDSLDEDSSDSSNFDDSDDDLFGSWGSSEETDTDSEEFDGDAFGSWGRSVESPVTTGNVSSKGDLPNRKSKIDYEIESNEKTADVLEKIATGIFGKGVFLKSKVTDKFKNSVRTQD